MNEQYRKFIERKSCRFDSRGLDAAGLDLAPHLFPFQDRCVRFGLEAGSWGLFLDTGLGKTACELEWSKHAAEAGCPRSGKGFACTALHPKSPNPATRPRLSRRYEVRMSPFRRGSSNGAMTLYVSSSMCKTALPPVGRRTQV